MPGGCWAGPVSPPCPVTSEFRPAPGPLTARPPPQSPAHTSGPRVAWGCTSQAVGRGPRSWWPAIGVGAGRLGGGAQDRTCGGGDEAGQSRGQSHGLGRLQPGPACQGPPPSPAHPCTDDTSEGGGPQAWVCTLGVGVREASRLQGPGQWTEHPETMPRPNRRPRPPLRVAC